MCIKTIKSKIYNENRKKEYLKDLAMNETINFKKFDRVFRQIKKTDDKISFLKKLNKALEEIDENNKNNNKAKLQ